MLFNSPEFLFLFLPLAFAGYQLLRRVDARWAIASLTIASFVFYIAWEPANSWVMILSILGNYACGLILERVRGGRWGSPILALGVGANLLALGYFKYTGFFVANTPFLGLDPAIGDIVLPEPILRNPATIGVARVPGNQGYINFLSNWVQQQRALGLAQGKLNAAWEKAGIDLSALPAGFSF